MNDYIVFDCLRNAIIDVTNYYMREDVEHVRIACIDGVYEMNLNRFSVNPPKNIKKLDVRCLGFYYTFPEQRRFDIKYDIISKKDADKYEKIVELTEYVCPICGHKHMYFEGTVEQCPLCGIGTLQKS